MTNENLKTPVVFMVFNRPETTEKVFNRIREARPEKLLVIADGSRATKDGEKDRCDAVREIIDGVDWPCEVIKNYADENMGCKKRISSGLDWAFSLVEEAIILEDDCLPDPSFFPYCSELLERYRNDERVMMISGSNFLYGQAKPEDSYYFSKYSNIWGWATWRRAWKHYDVNMSKWPGLKRQCFISKLLHDWYMSHYFNVTFDNVYNGKIDTWDAQWTFACMSNNGLSIVPADNLITNIGYGTCSGTHSGTLDKSAFIPLKQMKFPLKHSEKIENDGYLDSVEARLHFNKTFLGYGRCFLSKTKRFLGL